MPKTKTIKAWAVILSGKFLSYQSFKNDYLKPKKGNYSGAMIFAYEDKAKDFLRQRKAGGLTHFSKVVPIEIKILK